MMLADLHHRHKPQPVPAFTTPATLTHGEQHAIGEHLPDRSHLPEARVAKRRQMDVEPRRGFLAPLARKALRPLGQERRERGLAGDRVPPLLGGLDPTCGERRIGPLLIERAVARPGM